MSDLVAQTILEMLERENGTAELQRNELAGFLGCVPSQINYVLTSRFTPEQGYIVESRRGGGGYIKITRVKMDRETTIMHALNSVGGSIDQASARAILKNLFDRELIDERTLKIILAATSDSSYKEISPLQRDSLRSDIFKRILINLI